MTKALATFAVVLCLIAAAAAQTESVEPTEEPKIDQQQIRVLLDKAREATLLGKTAEAQKSLDELVEIARQGFSIKDSEVSTSILRSILDLDPRHMGALFNLAEIYRHTSPLRAVNYYNLYLEANPNSQAALFGRGSCYLGREAYSLAIADLKRLVQELNPNHIPGLTNLGLATAGRAAEKNYDPEMMKEAVGHIQRAVELAEASPEDPTAQAMLPDLRIRLARLNFNYQKILEQGSGGANFGEAVKLFGDAMKLVRQHVQSDPANPETINLLSQCYDGISGVYDAETQRNPQDPRPYLALADLVLIRTKEVDMLYAHVRSIIYLSRAIQKNPEMANLHVATARAYENLARFMAVELRMNPQAAVQKAIEAVSEAKRLDPQRADQYDQMVEKLVAATQPAKPTADTPQGESETSPALNAD